MTESSHGIRCKEEDKAEVVGKVTEILTRNGWKPFKE